MIYVTDTMALVLYIEKRRFGKQAALIYQESENRMHTIFVPTISLAEIGYLSERKRITCSLSHVRKLFEKNANIREYPLSFEIVQTAFGIDNIPELHDRLIAATAKTLGHPILTNDPVIIKSNACQTIW